MSLLLSMLSILALTTVVSLTDFVSAATTVVIPAEQDEIVQFVGMQKGDIISYSFTASDTVEFRISLESGGRVLYLIGTSASGRYPAPQDGDYEVRFTNLEQTPTTLTYTAIETETPFGLVIILVIAVVLAIATALIVSYTLVRAKRGFRPPGI